MKRIAIPTGGLLAMFLLTAGPTQADDPKSKPAESGAKTNYTVVGPLIGQIVKVDDKSITIRVVVPKQTGTGRNTRITSANQDYLMHFTPDVQVRIAHLPPKLDENGKKVKYTPEELKEHKGSDPKMPGYQAELSELIAGQVVTAQIVQIPNQQEKLVHLVYIMPQK